MKSMTGFGKSEGETSLGKIIVEARAENHRFLDMSFQLPEQISILESELGEIVKKSVLRGKVRISIAPEMLKNRRPSINVELAKESMQTLEKLKKELGMKEETELRHILMIKEFFSSEVKPTANKEDYNKIKAALVKAIEKLDDTRSAEGKKLEKDLKQRIDKLDKLTDKIKTKRKTSTKELADKLKERLNKLLKETEIDDSRLNQEIAILVERSDITEEIVRLKAHLGKFKEIFGKDGSVGRELDFLLQEMNREAGTIAAKSKDVDISHFTIEFRSELEKIKEQVQNIE